MSAPNRTAREASHLNSGLVAAKSAAALEKLIGGQNLSPQERMVVAKAEKLIESLANGVRVVSAGDSTSGKATRSVQVLREALSPIEMVRRLSADKDVAAMLNAMAETLRKVAEGSALNEAEQKIVGLTSGFFNQLYDSLLITIQQTRRKMTRHSTSTPATAGA